MRTILLALIAVTAYGQTTATSISDTIRTPVANSLFNGTVTFVPSHGMTCGTNSYIPQPVRVTVTSGVLSTSLVPNASCLPVDGSNNPASYYTARWSGSNFTLTETLVVPVSVTPVGLSSLRASVPSTATAVISPSQIAAAGATNGQGIIFNGTSWVAGTISATPSAHKTTHQNGGSDEIATATAAANAIPKAGAGGTLDNGWIGTLNQSTTGNAATATALATARAIGGVNFDGSAAIVPQTIQVVDGTDTTSSVLIADSATGDLQPKTDAGLGYNASTGVLTATGFSGPLTGNVTGNASGTAATITGAVAKANTPLTTKGDLWVTDGTSMNRLAVGTDAYVLTADAASTNGVKWAAASGGGTGDVVGTTGSGAPSANCTVGKAVYYDTTNEEWYVCGPTTNTWRRVLTVDDTLAGLLKLSELQANGANYRAFSVPDALTASLTFALPDAVPAAGDVMVLGAPSSDISAVTFKGVASANTASAIVTRDSSGNFSAGTITAALTGNASTATTLATARTIGGVSFDGSAAIVPQTIQTVDGTDTSSYVGIFDADTGNQQPKTDAGLTYNAGTGVLTATGFSGPLTGNVTGTATGIAAQYIDWSSGSGGTSIANKPNVATAAASGSLTTSGAYAVTLTATAATNVTLPTTGTLMVNPMTTAQDIIVGGASGAPGRLGVGSEGQVLKIVSGAAAWGTDSTGGSPAFSDVAAGTNTNALVVGTDGSLTTSGTGTITATAVPVGGVSGLGSGVATALATPSSANLATAVTDETGSGALVFATDPVFSTSVQIPNGTGPTVDAAGEIAVDTTTDQLQFYGGAKRALPTIQYASFVIPAPAEADDINLMKAPYGMTILGIDAIVQGTTSVTGQLQECSATGTDCADLDSDIVADADGAADDGTLTDATIASGAWIRWKTTSVSGTPTFLTVTVRFRVVPD